LVIAGLAAIGCRQVIGIEDAELEPMSSQAGSGAGSSSEVGTPLTDGGTESAGAAGAGGGAGEGGAAGEAGEPAASGAAGGPTELPSLCERYCLAVTSNCRGPFAVYTSYDSCLAVCALLPPGSPGDRGVNSVECRLHAATIAPSEVPHYCPIAGPGGNGECGTNCEGYCSLMSGVCADWVPTEPMKCLTDCQKLPDRGDFTSDVSGQDYMGNHVQCRLYHVCAAMSDDAEQHCRHADGALPCK
jgi:hypothetical protein